MGRIDCAGTGLKVKASSVISWMTSAVFAQGLDGRALLVFRPRLAFGPASPAFDAGRVRTPVTCTGGRGFRGARSTGEAAAPVHPSPGSLCRTDGPAQRHAAFRSPSGFERT